MAETDVIGLLEFVAITVSYLSYSLLMFYGS